MPLPKLFTEHPDFDAFTRRLAAVLEGLTVSRNGVAYRVTTPKWTKSKDVVSGAGALKRSGRWQCEGIGPTCYAPLNPETALAESLSAARYYNLPAHSDFPKAIVAVSYRLANVIDLADGHVRQRLRFSQETIVKSDWRRENREARESVTQAWGRAAIQIGISGFLTPSAANPKERNLIVFPANLSAGSVWKVEKEAKWPE